MFNKFQFTVAYMSFFLLFLLLSLSHSDVYHETGNQLNMKSSFLSANCKLYKERGVTWKENMRMTHAITPSVDVPTISILTGVIMQWNSLHWRGILDTICYSFLPSQNQGSFGFIMSRISSWGPNLIFCDSDLWRILQLIFEFISRPHIFISLIWNRF